MIYLKPKDGEKVYDPAAHDYLPEEGRNLPPTAYWLRRLRDGDVIEVASNNTISED